MMNELRIEKFFDKNHYLCRELFCSSETVIDAINGMASYIDATVQNSMLGTIEGDAWLDDRVQIGEGSYIERGAIIRGPTIIGKNTVIRSGAYLRGNVIIGDNCIIGFGTELHNVIALDNTNFPHKNCVFSSIFGNRINFAAFSTTANMRIDKQPVIISVKKGREKHKVSTGLSKFGSIVGDDSQIGAFVLLNPGTIIGKASMIMPHFSVCGWIEPNSIIKRD